MLDTIERTTATPDLLEIAGDKAAPATAPFTEDQARDFLKRFPTQRPTVRRLAIEWGWSKSRVDRFLKNLGTTVGQRDNGNDVRTHEQLRTLLTNGAKDFEAKFPEPTAEEAADAFIAERLLPQGQITAETIIAAGEKGLASPAKGGHNDFDDQPGDDELAVGIQCATWIYRGAANEVVIKQDQAAFQQDDVYVFVRAEYARVVAKRLLEVADAILRDREAA